MRGGCAARASLPPPPLSSVWVQWQDKVKTDGDRPVQMQWMTLVSWCLTRRRAFHDDLL